MKPNPTMFAAFCRVIAKRNEKRGYEAAKAYVEDYSNRYDLTEEQKQITNKIMEEINHV